jgi:superfamily II DNA or RNA helicase
MKAIKTGFYILPKNKKTLKIVKKSTYMNSDKKLVCSAEVGDNYIKFPRNINKLENLLEEKLEIVNKTIATPLDKHLNLVSNFKLRDYQKEAIEPLIKIIKEKENALLNAPTSFGKSYILPYVIKEIGVKTLILVDRNNLVTQMKDEFIKNTGEEPNILNSKNKKIKDVNNTTLQFLHRNPQFLKELSKVIGFVVLDEVHTTGVATSYRDIISNLKHKYQLGMTATPTRSDGLTEVLFDILGEHKIVGKIKSIQVTHKLVVVNGEPQWVGNGFAEAFSNTVTHPKLVESIVDSIEKLVKMGRTILLYATYKDIRNIYAAELEQRGISVSIVDSSTPIKERDRIFKDIQTNKIDVLLSGNVVTKGISIAKLDTIINLASLNKENLEQVLGRARREHKDKKDVWFIDFYFKGYLKKNGAERYRNLKKIAKKYGDKIEEMKWSEFKEIL